VLTSGSSLVGYWTATSTIPKGAVGGDWNVSVWVNDRLHDGRPDYWWGPDYWRWSQAQGFDDPRDHELPNGTFKVIGVSDNTAAQVVGVRADRAQVDTLAAGQSVTFDIHAKDAAGEGVTAVSLYLAVEHQSGTGSDPTFPPVDATLVSGTAVDGWWRATVVLPQGTPPGRYPLTQVMIEDRAHWRSYTTPHSEFAGQSGQLALTESQLSLTGGGAWDGVITVVQNPAG
jgi:hypothetical protein